MAWTAIGLLAATLAVLAGGVLQIGARAAFTQAGFAQVNARIHSLSARLDVHLERPAG